MMSNIRTKIRVLVLRDLLAGAGYELGEDGTPRNPLSAEPRLSVTVASAGYGEAVRAGEKHRPDVILLDGVLTDPCQLVAELDEALHVTPVLVILDEVDRDRVQDCISSGARGCLVRPLEPDALVQTIIRVHERALRQRKRYDAELQAGGGKVQSSHIIAVRGAKGGVGSTVVATNLAVAIKRQSGLRVALVDGHFFGGDVPVMLDLQPGRGIAELIPHLHGLDDELLSKTLVEHASGVAVLAAPPEYAAAESITPDDLHQVLEALRTHYDYVVIDCSPFLDQNSLVALDLADLLLLVSTPDIVALKNASRLLQLGTELGYSEAKMRLVINRSKSPGAVSPHDFERHLNYRMSFSIPNDTAVIRALTRGAPVVTHERHSRAARSLERLAEAVLVNAGWAGEPAGRSGRLLGLPAFPRLGALLSARRPELLG